VTYLHVAGGMVALVAGAIALAARKGGTLHRRGGMVFVYAMLLMSGSGALIAALHPPVVMINVIAGVVTFYLVSTAVLAVRRPVLEFQRADRVAFAAAAVVTVVAFALGLAAMARPRDPNAPAVIFFMFGIVALLATLGDWRVLRAGRLEGRKRLARHLWRMCFAFYIAAASFFLGPPRRLPAFLRGSPLRPVPVLLVLVVMIFWLVRVRNPRALAFGLRPARPA
jgi:uncharacterized membrane protein